MDEDLEGFLDEDLEVALEGALEEDLEGSLDDDLDGSLEEDLDGSWDEDLDREEVLVWGMVAGGQVAGEAEVEVGLIVWREEEGDQVGGVTAR